MPKPRRVYFCFHYKDVMEFRANVVRKHWVTKPDREEAGYIDWSIWEEAKKKGSIALKRLVNSELDGSSNTCVLIGSETYERPWVRYELMKSFKRDNHIFGVHINSIRGKDQKTKILGPNPLKYLGVRFSKSGITRTLMEWRGGEWKEYEKIGGSANYESYVVTTEYRDRFFQFSKLFPVYDWVGDDGYDNFSDWVV
jgi:hypothetical protein